jgi:hypothetical protein
MKISAIISALLCCSFIASCATDPSGGAVERAPSLNQNDFTGLVSLGSNVTSLQLDYSLDTPVGKELRLDSCAAVKDAQETDVETSQYHLLQLMKVDCIAADYYFKALNVGAVSSFLPATIDAGFIESLPAQAVPDLGGQSLEKRDSSLLESEKDLQVLSTDGGAVELSLSGDLVVKYIVMARGDFDQDGFEDLLLRLDWYISTAFGKGFDLIMVTQTSISSKSMLIWRR